MPKISKYLPIKPLIFTPYFTEYIFKFASVLYAEIGILYYSNIYYVHEYQHLKT
jgi:hypothetical protein